VKRAAGVSLKTKMEPQMNGMNADLIGESTLLPTHLPGERTSRSKHLVFNQLSASILFICGF
jgi:hypothetical protein